MADEKDLRSSADRDADAALEAILREVEASPRRTARKRELDDLDFVQTGTPRSHAATPKTPVRDHSAEPAEPVVKTDEAAPVKKLREENEAPARKPREDNTAQARKPREENEAPVRRPREENEAPVRRPREDNAAPARRPREDNAAPARRPREDNAAPARRPREENAAPVRRPREDNAAPARRPREENAVPQRRRPEGQRMSAQQNRPARDVERVDQPQRRAPQQNAPRREHPQEPQRSRQPQQRAVQERSAHPQQNRSAERPQAHRAGAAVRRRPNYFRIGLAIYIMLGIILTLWGMRRLYNFLKEYEASRPQYTIDGFVSHLDNGFYSDMVRQKVDEIDVTEYETADTIASTLDIESMSGTGYTWAKKVDEFTDEKPVYYIRYQGASIATVTLQRAGGTDQFDFPVWKALDPQSLIEIPIEPEYTLDATVPNGGSLMVNGLKVPMTSLTDTEYEMNLDEVAQSVTPNPVGQHVKISDLFVAPTVRAFDKDGNELEAKEVPDKSVKEQVLVFEPAAKAEPNEQIVERMQNLTKAYINYMINKDEATGANWGAVGNYLLNGSDAFKVLKGIYSDVAWNNPYTAREDKVLEVSNIRMYSDTICTADTHFELQLTKESNNGTVTNDYNGTVRWVMVKNGNAWYASHFDLLSGEDAAAAPADEAPAEE